MHGQMYNTEKQKTKESSIFLFKPAIWIQPELCFLDKNRMVLFKLDAVQPID